MEVKLKIFHNRRDAGNILAGKLSAYKDQLPVVIAIPHGGVPVGMPIARSLEAPLDTLVVRPLKTPSGKEFGAIAPGDIIIIDRAITAEAGIDESEISAILIREKEAMEFQLARYRSGEFLSARKFDTVIIVDDGTATGIAARAAIESIKLIFRPTVIILAIPICSNETTALIRNEVSDVVCLHIPNSVTSPAEWYEHFEAISDQEIIHALDSVNREKKSSSGFV